MRKRFFISILILLISFTLCFGQIIKIKEPNSRSEWIKGERYMIIWEKSGVMSKAVKIRLYQEGRKILSITDLTENDGLFEWVIPQEIQEGYYYIRVKTVDNRVYDDSDVFRIKKALKGKIIITSPLDGDYWQKGKKYYVKWKSEGEINPFVKIRLYNENKEVLKITDRAPNNGSFLWEIPQNIEEGYYYIRVKTIDNLIYDNSDPFVITNPSQRKITVIYPNGGEKIGAPGTLEIKWKASPEIKYVRIVGLYIPQGRTEPVKQVLAERENTGSFSIQMSEKIYDSKKYKVRIEDCNNPSVYDESDGYFEIYHKNKPYLKVVYPRGGESFNMGDKIEVKWEAKGFDLEVKGELWKGNGKIGTIFENLTMNQALEGKRLWTVGETKEGGKISGGNDYYIKLIAKNINGLQSSGGSFSINVKNKEGKPYIERVYPQKAYSDEDIFIFGKNFHNENDYAVYLYGGGSKIFTDVSKWSSSRIIFKIRDKNIKPGVYKVGIEKKHSIEKSNMVNLEVVKREKCFLKIVYLKLLKDRYTLNDKLQYLMRVKNMSNEEYKGDLLPIVDFIGIKKNTYRTYWDVVLKPGEERDLKIVHLPLKEFISKGGRYSVKFGIAGEMVRGKKGCEDNVSEKFVIYVSSDVKKEYDLKATNCAYVKNVFTKGEMGDFSITPYNSGPSTVSGYKITAWSVRGDGTGLIMIRGRTNFSDRRQTVLKSGQSKMEYFKVKINDSPGDYTLFVKVEAQSPSANLDKNQSNNVCKIRYKVVYKTKILSTYNKRVLLTFPDLTFDRVRTKIGVNGIEAVIKNLKYKSAKLPLPEVKKIYVRIVNTSKERFSINALEFFLPKFVIKELNEKGETDYLSRLNIVFPEAKLVIDSKNNIIESNETNNSMSIK